MKIYIKKTRKGKRNLIIKLMFYTLKFGERIKRNVIIILKEIKRVSVSI